jgi:hypothetical protein
MEVNALNIRKSLNKAYLKVKPNRTQIETFKKNIINLFDRIDESESEEFHKNIISEFLRNTYYIILPVITLTRKAGPILLYTQVRIHRHLSGFFSRPRNQEKAVK